MTHLVQIGNSQGIRIPKPLIEQAHLLGSELSLTVVNDGILISLKRNVRAGWKDTIASTLAKSGIEEVNSEWLDANLSSDSDLEW